MPVIISRLTEADIPGAIECIQQAFADDPYNHWVFNRETFSLTRNSVSLGIRCHWGIRNALFYVAKADPATTDAKDIGTEADDGKVLGVACWMPPRQAGQLESWAEWLQAWVLWGRQVAMNIWWGRGGLNAKRYYIWKSSQAAAQRELWDDPQGYYFCNIVTVLPSKQGKGIGKMLFETVTSKADAEGRKCYLESSRDEPNTAIYERLGFRKVKEMDCDDNGTICKLFCMIRDPQPSLRPRQGKSAVFDASH